MCIHHGFSACVQKVLCTEEFVSASVDLCNYLCVYTMTPVKVCNCVCAEGVYNNFCSYLNSTAVVYARNKIAVHVILSCMECHNNHTCMSMASLVHVLPGTSMGVGSMYRCNLTCCLNSSSNQQLPVLNFIIGSELISHHCFHTDRICTHIATWQTVHLT